MAISSFWLELASRRWEQSNVNAPIGPSLQIVLALCDAFAEVSFRAAKSGWQRWFGHERFHRKLAEFEDKGWVLREARPGNLGRVIRLTEAGRLAALGGRDPEACWRRAWDGRWRLILFDIPEAKSAVRLRLWRQLRTLGFGYLQHSVWLSPDSTAMLKGLIEGITPDVETFTLMEARPCGGESDGDLTNGAWDFVRINHNYRVYLEVLKSQPALLFGRSWRAWFEVEWKAWKKAVGEDPLLPEPLLPIGYLGREAWHRRQANLRTRFKLD